MPPEDDDADLNADKGAGEDGDQGDPKKSSKDDDKIPASRLTAALANAESTWAERFAAQQRELDALKAAATKQAEPKAPTRAELLAAVEAGTITQLQADTEFERQIVERATKAAEQAARTVTVASTATTRVEADLAEFKRLAGDAWVAGSAERTKVEAAYRRLISRSFPDGIATELAALETVYGDLDTLRESKKARLGPSERHVEEGGTGGGGGKPNGGGKDDPIQGLNAREKAHYGKLIDRGVYKDWAAVREERKGYSRQKA